MASTSLRRPRAKRKVPQKPPAAATPEHPVWETDFKDPDSSPVGMYLQRAGALLTLLDDLHCEALEIDYSKISENLGQSKDTLIYTLVESAIEDAGRQLALAREALHALFAQVQLKAEVA